MSIKYDTYVYFYGGNNTKMNKERIAYFESLFHQLQPKLFVFCCKYIEDRELARDFVQECFVNLWENFETVETSYASYLFTAVRNRCISYYRSLRISAEYEDTVKLSLREIEFHPEISEPLTEIYLKDIQELIAYSIDRLPEKCKQIFKMSRYQGMKNTEIAMALNISVRTVEAQIYNALKVLKESLKDYLLIIFLFLFV